MSTSRLIACLAALLLSQACGGQAPQAAHSSGSDRDFESLAGLEISRGPFPLVLRAPDGSEQTLARPPERLLPTNAGLFDLLSALVPPERIVALPRSAVAYSVALERGYPFDQTRCIDVLDSESVLARQADLILARPWQSREQRWQWERAGLTVITLENPETIEDCYEDLALLGRLCDEEPRARAEIARLETRVADLAASSAARREVRLLDYTNGGSGGWIAGRGTTFDLLCQLTGATNAGAEFEGHTRADLEAVRRIDPSAFVVSSPTGAPGESSTRTYLENEQRLADLQAVQAGAYIELPATLSGTDAQFLVDAAERIARWIDAR